MIDLKTKIKRKINKIGGCWIWTGNKKNGCAGSLGILVDGVRKNVAVHRLSYMAFIGEIPSGMFVKQKCKNKLCVNPKHLVLFGNNQKMMGRIVDLTGKRFGKLVAIKYVEKDNKRGAIWLCKCDCGKEKKVSSLHLTNGDTNSCGCLGHPNKRLNLTGKKFGKLTALEIDHGGSRGVWWLFQCDCGEKKVFPASPVYHGTIKSCGCIQRRTDQQVYYNKYRKQALRDKREFTLTIDEFWEIVHQNCYLCGAEPILRRMSSKGTHTIFVNGIDRMDNTQGYTPENSRPCCSICNRSKMDHRLDTWLDWLNRAYNHQLNTGGISNAAIPQ